MHRCGSFKDAGGPPRPALMQVRVITLGLASTAVVLASTVVREQRLGRAACRAGRTSRRAVRTARSRRLGGCQRGHVLGGSGRTTAHRSEGSLFLSRDPIEALTRSAYGYVEGDPLNATDPSGLIGFSDITGAAGDVWDNTGGRAVSAVSDHRHTIINFGVSVGAATVAAGCGLTVVCAVGVAGVAAAGAASHLASDALIDDDNRISVRDAVLGSTASAGAGAICGWTLGQGCGPAVAGRTSTVPRSSLPFLARLITRTDRARNLGRTMTAAFAAYVAIGRQAIAHAEVC